jgi:nucleoside phosphorylase
VRTKPGTDQDADGVPIDFAILTAIEVERKAVCAALGLGKSHRVKKEGRIYWRGRLALGDGDAYEIVVAQPTDMGQVEAAVLANDVIRVWKPAAALLVGIAATTDPKKVKLGDVVVGRSIWYYEHGKVTPDGKKPQPEMMPADARLLQHLAGLAEWDHQIMAPRPDGTNATPKLHQGVIASGEKVIAAEAVRDDIASGHRKIIALAMEEYGFTRAMWQSERRVHHLVIRGICDEASSAKDDGWHEYAAAAVASFAKHFLLDRPLEPHPRPDAASNHSTSAPPETPLSNPKAEIRDRLIELVGRVSWDRRALVQAYACCVAGEQRHKFDGQRGADLAARMIRALFGMVPQDDGAIPLVLFFWHLVAIANAPEAPAELNQLTGSLSDLFDEAIEAMNLPVATVETWKRRVEVDQDRLKELELHLVIVAEPRIGRSTYSVRAFRALVPRGSTKWMDDDIGPLQVPGGDDLEVRNDAELAKVVNELLLGIDSDIARVRDSTIELFVPAALLGCDADQWNVVDDICGNIRLGSEFNVVVRCWERVYSRRIGTATQKWKVQWERLFSRHSGSIWRCNSDDVRGTRLQLPREHPACVVMGNVPPENATLMNIISGGTAIALWPRKLVQGSLELEGFLSNRLSTSELDVWRDEVREYRKLAATDAASNEHPGSHLSLLWDDPNKLPPDAPGRCKPLEPPTKMVK